MKSKKSTVNPLAELHFVSTLDLDRALQLVMNFGASYPVTITEQNPDTVEFEIRYDTGTIEGTLQRWQGTETRVNCTGEVIRIPTSVHPDYDIQSTTLFIGFGVCIFLLMAGQTALAFLEMGFLVVYHIWFASRDRHDKPDTIPIFRERDAIFQQMIDRFKAQGSVSVL